MRRDTFSWFVAYARSENWFPGQEKPDASGRMGAPLELMIMGALAILGGVLRFQALTLLTHVSHQTHRSFFKVFCKVGATKMFPLWVKPPSTPEEIANAMRDYEEAGFPGAICSTDGTRIPWKNPKYNLRHRSTGKEGFPTRVFQISVNNRREIFSSTKGFDGSSNDMTVTQYDPFLKALHNKQIYGEVEWELLNKDGVSETMKGLWSLVDGGYPDWIELICPVGATVDPEAAAWSRMLESLRKDVECTFGILKKRFGILKDGIYFQSLELIDEVWFTICALQNRSGFADED
jgi:hypothetical protein